MTTQVKRVTVIIGNVITIFLICFYMAGFSFGTKSNAFGFVGVMFFIASPILLTFQILTTSVTRRTDFVGKTKTAMFCVNIIGVLIFAFFTVVLVLTGTALSLP